MENTLNKMEKQQAFAEKSMQMVIMDAIEKGHTNVNELTSFVKSETFFKAAMAYQNSFKQAFNN